MSQQPKKTTLSYRLTQQALTVFKVVLFSMALTATILYTRATTPERVQAAVPATLNFQARLLKSSGSIVADGTYNVEFKIYNTLTSAGSSQGSCAGDATCLWTETRLTTDAANLRVTVKSGYLSVYLGDKTALPSNIWDQQLYLTMNIGGTTGTPSWDGEMAPRLRLTSVPYAFQAAKATQLQQIAGANTGTLSFGALTTNPTIALPDASGTVCLQGVSACGFAATTGGSGYIQNGTAIQTNANFAIQSAAAGSVGGVIRGAASQTSDLLQLQNSSGTTLTYVNSAGTIVAPQFLFGAGGIQFVGTGSGGGPLLTGGGNALTIASQGAVHIPLALKAHASQTADLQQWQDSSGGVYGAVDSTFRVVIAPGTGTSGLKGLASLFVQGRVGTETVTILRTRGTGNILQLQNSAGSNVSNFDSAGRLVIAPGTGSDAVGVLASLTIQPQFSTDIGAVIQGRVSQSADLLQLQDSTGSVLAKIQSNGIINGLAGVQGTALGIGIAPNSVTAGINVQYANSANAGIFDSTNATANGVSLDVQSSSSSQYALNVTSNNGATSLIYARADGNVGIGTAAPGANLDVQGGTITAQQPFLNVGGTWNNAGVIFTGIKSNVVNTASGASSLLLDLQVGSVSQFNVRKDGVVQLGASGEFRTGSGNSSTLTGLGLRSGSTSTGLQLGYAGVAGSYSSEIDLAGITQASNPGTIIFRAGTASAQQAEVARFNASGNFGLGTTTPTSTLQTQGAAGVSSGATTMTAANAATTFTTSVSMTLNAGDYIIPTTTTGQARSIVTTATGTSFTVTPAFTAGVTAETFTIYRGITNLTNQAGTSALFVQGSTGNVGVGTTAPANRLEIYTSGTSSGGLRVTHSAAQSLRYVELNYDPGTSQAFLNFTTGGVATRRFDIQADGSPIVSFQTNGNVGIGTTAPGAKLDIKDTASVASLTGNSKGLLTLQGSASAGDYNALSFSGNDGNVSAKIGTRRTASGSYLSFGTSNSYVAGVTNEALVIDYNGNVGIGTTAPTSLLQIGLSTDAHTSVSQGDLSIRYNTSERVRLAQNVVSFGAGLGGSGAGGIRINGDGGTTSYGVISASGTSLVLNGAGNNVGIGTTTPTSTLQTQGAAGVSSGATTMTAANGATTFTTSVSMTLNAGDYIIPTTTTGQARSVVTTATGTTFTVTPAFAAGVTAETFTIYRGITNLTNQAGTSALFVQGSTGNVGIGTTAPNEKLDVVGNIRASGVFRAGNGSTSSVSYGFSDANTGLYLQTGGALGLVGNGTEGLRVRPAVQYVWVSPAADNTTAAAGIAFGLSRDTNLYRSAADTLRTNDSFIVDGNVGIGTTTPDIYGLGFTKQLTVSTNGASVSTSTLSLAGGTTGSARLEFGNENILRSAIQGLDGSNLTFSTNSTNSGTSLTERLRIQSDGNVGVGTTGAPAQLLSVGGTTGNFTVSSAGAVVGVGVNAGSGLLQGAAGLTITGTTTLSSLTTAGIVTNTASGVLGTVAALPVANGGTGLVSYTVGDLLYASGTTTIGKLAAVAAGSCLVSQGVGVAPAYGSCGVGGGSTLQAAYTTSTGGTTSELLLDTTRGALDIQDRSTTNGGTIGANLFNVRATAANDATAGAVLFSVGNTGAVLAKNSTNSTNAFQIQNAAGTSIFNVDSTNTKITTGADLVGAGIATATTGTTEAIARTNVTTVTLTAAGSFANNDVIFINNAGQDYYTRITAGGGTTTLTVSPAVSYDASASVTKYTIQNIGASTTDYTTLNNRFFQGYFLGGVVTGAGSTTLSDGNLSSTGALNFGTNGSTKLTVTTAGSLQFAQGADRLLNIAQATSGAGNNLYIAAGNAQASGNVNGGNLMLQGGTGNGTGTSGSVIVRNGFDNSTTFQIQNSTGNSLLTANTAGMNLVVGGDIYANTASLGSSGAFSLTIDSVSGGAATAVVVPADGIPVVAYTNSVTLAGGTDVAKCTSSSCSASTKRKTFYANGKYASIAIGTNGLPTISSYRDTFVGENDLSVLACADSRCTTFATVVSPDTTGDVGQYTSVVIGSDGFPVVSYYDVTNGNLKILKCGNAGCTTGNTITAVDTTGDVGQHTSIKLGTDNLPVVSYYDVTNANLKVIKCGNTSCSSGNTTTTLDSTGDVGQYASIAVPSTNLPVISYYDVTNGSLKILKCGNTSCSSGNTITTADAGNNPPCVGFVCSTDDKGRYSSISIGSDGFPIVSYNKSESNDDTQFNFGTNSQFLRVLDCSNATCAGGTTITDLDTATSSYCDGCQAQPAANSVGSYTSITVPSDGKPVISYYYDAETAVGVPGRYVKVIKCTNTTCSVPTTTTVGVGLSVGSETANFSSAYINSIRTPDANTPLSFITNGLERLSISGTGQALFKSDNSTSAFQVQNAAGSTVFNVDTTNQRVGIGTNAPGSLLSVGALTTASASSQLAVGTGAAGNKGIVVQGVAAQTGDLLQAQDSTGAVLAKIDSGGNLTVKAATINGTLTVNGHIVTANSSGTTTITAGAAINCGGETVSVNGNDTAGTITITPGTTGCSTTGTLATITFATAYASAPRVVISPDNLDATNLKYYTSNRTTTTFGFSTNTIPADATVYTYNYQVLQ